jgi:peptidoglycan L-alanyl-D-glutamate endopeptidase CwlK
LSVSFTNLASPLATAIPKILAAMNALGFPMVITYTLRTAAEQQALYAQGRTAPGKIVTELDGIIKQSKHQSGRAADLAFLKDGKPSWDDSFPWACYGACAKALGLTWGGDWHSIPDRPHIEC